ncbi:rhombosortase [Salinivibrio sp. IB574]|uniref:rhombosortase n=1 Tax=Salinivibrio sp. IB574 TaxID=1909444 RepID=UPI000D52A9FC|nr:rhombosortase [Salinivibrio sp. IB574]
MSPIKLIMILTVTVIIAQTPTIHDAFIWDRIAIESGQWWRIITGNLTHTNLEHLAINLSGLVVLYFFHGHYYDHKLLVPIVLMMLAIGIAMLLSPFDWYAGLSGVLYGLFAWGCVRDIKNNASCGKVLLAGVVIKLGIDSYTGGNAITEALINAGVAYQAHWIGIVVGLVCAITLSCRGESSTD